MRIIGSAVGFGLLALSSTVATAHPHVFVDSRSDIVLNSDKQITAIRHIWQFDEAFTAYATQGLDVDGDGTLSATELEPLAKVNVESLADFGFFTYLVLENDGKTVPFMQPEEYWLEFYDGRLTLFYTLPLEEPVTVGAATTLEVFDPEYFVAFSYYEDTPVTLTDAPAGCSAQYHPPQELDSASIAILGSIPASQRDLPPELQELTAGLSNLITIHCG